MSGKRAPTVIATLDQTFERALTLHQKGQLQAAESLYRAVLDADRRHFDALLYLGVLRLQQGYAQEAATLIEEALGQNPHSPEAHANLASALQVLQQHDKAIACYERALVLNPGFAEANHGLPAKGRISQSPCKPSVWIAVRPARMGWARPSTARGCVGSAPPTSAGSQLPPRRPTRSSTRTSALWG